MYIDNFMYDLTLNDKGELIVLIDIPKALQDETIEDVEIRISKKDLERMKHVFEMNESMKLREY